MNNNIFMRLIFIIALFTTSNVNAILIDNGTYSTDTVTGLDWLDLTETNNFTYTYVNSQLGLGGVWEGWNIANSNQTIELWNNFDIDLSTSIQNNPNLNFSTLIPRLNGYDSRVSDAANFLGSTLCDYNCTYYPEGTYGMVSDAMPYNPFQRMLLGAYWYAPGDQTLYFSYGAGGDYENTFTPRPAYGVYLVRDAVSVPEPKISWLLTAGLLMMVGFTHTRKSNSILRNT